MGCRKWARLVGSYYYVDKINLWCNILLPLLPFRVLFCILDMIPYHERFGSCQICKLDFTKMDDLSKKKKYREVTKEWLWLFKEEGQ